MFSHWTLYRRGWEWVQQRFDTERSGSGRVYGHGRELGVSATDSVVYILSLGILGLRAFRMLIYRCSMDVWAGVQ
jgi:hypothetical protein